ncbi:DUF4258 domain-containing protein [bacterium]|nr:DUF4258 domain-containing protein [bacterium]
MRNAVQRLRQLIREQKYRISGHANEEMSEDDLTALDIEQAIITGKIAKRFTKDPRGTRFEIIGKALDGEHVGVVCRLLVTGWLRIITAYRIEDDNNEKRKV